MLQGCFVVFEIIKQYDTDNDTLYTLDPVIEGPRVLFFPMWQDNVIGRGELACILRY